MVDDGSGDGLDRVMAGYADHPAIRYLKNEKNMGAAASRNRGVAEAKGVYTAFLDADDWWEEGKLEKAACPVGKDRDSTLFHSQRAGDT